MNLQNGLRVVVWRLGDAGGYKVESVETFSVKVSLLLSGGQPFNSAYKEAEQLAITIDAEFVVNGEVIRKSLSGEYYEEQEVKK